MDILENRRLDEPHAVRVQKWYKAPCGIVVFSAWSKYIGSLGGNPQFIALHS